jgi:hypothetical protein
MKAFSPNLRKSGLPPQTFSSVRPFSFWPTNRFSRSSSLLFPPSTPAAHLGRSSSAQLRPDPNPPEQPSALTGPSEPSLRPEAEAAMAPPPALLACTPGAPWGPRPYLTLYPRPRAPAQPAAASCALPAAPPPYAGARAAASRPTRRRLTAGFRPLPPSSTEVSHPS